MKRLTYAIVLLVIFGFLPFNNIHAFQNEPDGFRDIKWGANANRIQGLKYMPVFDDHDRGLLTYIRDRDKRFIDDVLIMSISYCADMDNNKIISASLRFNCNDYDSIKNNLINKYGAGEAAKNQWGTRINWKGDKTTIILINSMPSMNMCTLWYRSTESIEKFTPPAERKGH